MENRSFPVRILAWWAGLSLCLAAIAAGAQLPDLGLPTDGDSAGFPFGAGGVLGEGDRVPRFEAGFTAPGPDGSAQLFIVASLPPGVNTYSTTQRPGGPHATRIEVSTTTDVPKIGTFRSLELPRIKYVEDVWPGLPLEEHFGSVKWVAPIQLAAGVKPETVKIEGKVNVQLCDAKGCVPSKNYPFTAALRADVKAVVVPAAQGPKETAPAAQPSEKTLPSSPPAKPSASAGSAAPPATNTVQPRATKGGERLAWRRFTTVAALGDLVGPEFDLEKIRANVRGSDAGLSIGGAIFFGFIGGLILNVMPCVLPVIGLKILSFVQQAGHNRRRAFMLNVWYSAGLLAVFFILASLAVGPQRLGWGQLFAETWFTVTLTAVVFVMALSFMGVWEVPLPTFLGRGKASTLAAQEGPVGAFFKGALTTLLATPCSAPFLAPALVWATAQPAWLTYAVFLSVGLGMASPYLLVGAFPELLRFLPKPGPWMETFKQFMGFVLIGTVVYLLTVLEPYNVVPTVGLLFGLWFTCWWIGRLGPLVDLGVKLRAWCLGAAFCCVVWIVMFPGIGNNALGSYSFSGLSDIMRARLGMDEEEEDEGPPLIGPKTVLVDFTADWCVTCKVNEARVMGTAPVVEAIRQSGVVTLKADWTHRARSVEVTRMLDVLGSGQVPVIAVFSADDPNNPSVFRGSYTQDDILGALEKAGPSPPDAQEVAKAM
jgi:thiol:disulfide interchange protein DsbD